MAERVGQVRIAGRRLYWETWGKEHGQQTWCLMREDDSRLYQIEKAADKKVGQEGAFVVTATHLKKEIGRAANLKQAMALAHQHFAVGHSGVFEGYWTSYRMTYKLYKDLREKIINTPTTDKYPHYVPSVCPFCGSSDVEITSGPNTMASERQKMTCHHCAEFVSVYMDFSSSSVDFLKRHGSFRD